MTMVGIKDAGRRSTAPPPGTRIEVRGEQWLVRSSESEPSGGWAVRCVGLHGIVRGFEATFLNNLDEIKEVRPELTDLVQDSSPNYRRARLYIDALLRRTPFTDTRIHLGHQAAMNQTQYQLVPTQLALNALRPSVLIADGVGIGKTLEVGILLSELIKRGRGERILVLTLRSVLEQFQKELWSRFAIPLVRLDSEHIARIKTKIPPSKNPFHVHHRCIVSIDTLKNDGRYRTYLEQCRWDAIVIDECHHIANEGNMRSRLADLLASRTESLIMTSATPHNGRPESFARLMNMLNPTAVADTKDYGVEDVRGLFVRRFKKDIADDGEFSTREVEILECPATPAETNLLKRFQQLSFRTLDRKRKGRDILFRYALMKSFLSSPEACWETVTNRIARIETDLKESQAERSGREDDLGKLEMLRDQIQPLLAVPASKVGQLINLLKDFKVGPRSTVRVIVFAERRVTLEALKGHLLEGLNLKDEAVTVFHGGLADVEQMSIVERFGQEDSKIRVLLAGDVASEGVNLHYFCNHLVHFDIPWSPITIEQRNGRIDRYGQEKPPIIRYLLTQTDDPQAKDDMRIYKRLIEKDEAIQKNMGDPSLMMRKFSAAEEEETLIEAVSNDDLERVLEPEVDEATRLLELLMQAGQITESEEPMTASSASLYKSDLDFFKDGIALLWDPNNPVPMGVDRPEVEGDFIAFSPPKDLKQILRQQLPDEALPDDGEYRLTANRKDMIEAIEAARRKSKSGDESAWPDRHLLWELHPIFQWLIERVLIEFGKNEAPIIRVPNLSMEPTYLFQGTLANPLGQVAIAFWFGVGPGGKNARIVPLEKLLEETGFDRQTPNSGIAVKPEALKKGLREAVEAAERHMVQLRAERLAHREPEIAEANAQIEEWLARRKLQLQRYEKDHRSKTTGDLPRHFKEKLAADKKAMENQHREHRRFVEETLGIVERPSLRLAAVFVSE